MKIDILFCLLKDTTKTSTDKKREILRRKYPDIDITELHRRIVNYQVRKYGETLNNYQPNKTYDEYKKIVINRKCRRKKRLYGRKKNFKEN